MRNRKRRKFLILILISIPLILLLIFLIFRIGLFNIKKIEVEGDRLGCADNDQIKDSSKLLGQNFFTLDQKKLTKSLKEKFICIKDVNLSKTFPNKVGIKVSLRQPAAILATLKKWPIATPSAEDISETFVIDDEGVVFSKDSENLNVPKVFVANLNFPGISFLQILDKIKTLGIDIKDTFIDDNFFAVNSETGPQIIFGLDDPVDVQLASLQLILDKAKIDSSVLEFVDLRYDKPVVRFAPKK